MNKSQPLSNCCNAEMLVSNADEGTAYYLCSKCHSACDPASPSNPIEKDCLCGTASDLSDRRLLTINDACPLHGAKDENATDKSSVKEEPDSVSGWEARFDERFCFDNFDGKTHYKSLFTNRDQTKDIKAFIKAELSHQKKQLQEKVKALEEYGDWMEASTPGGIQPFVACLKKEDVLKLLED